MRKYEKPEITIAKFDAENIITTSSTDIDGGITIFPGSWLSTDVDGESTSFLGSWLE